MENLSRWKSFSVSIICLPLPHLRDPRSFTTILALRSRVISHKNSWRSCLHRLCNRWSVLRLRKHLAKMAKTFSRFVVFTCRAPSSYPSRHQSSIHWFCLRCYYFLIPLLQSGKVIQLAEVYKQHQDVRVGQYHILIRGCWSWCIKAAKPFSPNHCLFGSGCDWILSLKQRATDQTGQKPLTQKMVLRGSRTSTKGGFHLSTPLKRSSS